MSSAPGEPVPLHVRVGCVLWFVAMLVALGAGLRLSLDETAYYARFDPNAAQTLRAHEARNLAGRQLLPDFRVFGVVEQTGRPASIRVFRKQFEAFVPGARFEVLPDPGEPGRYVDARRYRNHRPLAWLGSVPVAWHFGVVIVLIAIMVLAFVDLVRRDGWERVQQMRFLSTLFYGKTTLIVVTLTLYSCRPV